MKNVLIAIVLLGLAAGLTLLNALWVDAKMASLLALATEDRPKEALEEFLAAEPFLALTVHEAALKNTEIALREMLVWQTSHPEEYAAARERFCSLLSEIRSKEKFSFSNLF